MTRIIVAVIVLVVLSECVMFCAPLLAVADIYKCKHPDGTTLYQQIPCAGGEEKALNDRQARLRSEDERKRKPLLPTASR